MKKHISELKNEKAKYYKAVTIWFEGGESEYYDFETVDVSFRKDGSPVIEVTDYCMGLYYFAENKETIHMYYGSENELPKAEYYELIEDEGDN